ncbi:unnamed protein product [Linum trigynum]|uniref:Gnk2-homologous domain-containing protein n=1 Tax=Linum trigynum TaxID=586398 RepID=A0AAV2CNI3_9ROSI
MAMQVGRLDARMGTLLISSLVLTMINVGFHGSVIITAEAALDPLCGASSEWFCSPTDLDIPNAQDPLLQKLRVIRECDLANYRYVPLVAYVHTSCAHGHTCDDCLRRATQIMRENCPGKNGAQYGNEECCVRYEMYKFC